MNQQRSINLPSMIGLTLALMFLMFMPTSSVAWLTPDASTLALENKIWEIPQGDCSMPVDSEWIEKVNHIRWVAYSSPNPNPDRRFYQPTAEVIYQDLLVLKKAKFTGLVTYGSSGIMGREFLTIAQTLGYQGVIMGIWNPLNEVELKNARNATSLPIVMGYSIGNEGLDRNRNRYTVSDLCSAISGLRSSTGKPATTSEDIDDYYSHPDLLLVGDWLFPIVHPYWHFTKYPAAAIRWEEEQYNNLLDKTDRFILFKEVGLPTSGAYGLSEASHDQYYRGLAKTGVRFVYFEGFDQPSKITSSVEPHWGIFRSTRKPKLLGWNLMGYRLFTSDGAHDGWVLECSETSGKGCSSDISESKILVGDDSQDRQYRAILSFNTASLPDNAVITSARLKVKSAGMVGAGLFNKRQRLKVDACTPFLGAGLKLQVIDFQQGENCRPGGTFDNKPHNGWYLANLDLAELPLVNLTGITQFRLRFSRDDNNDSGADYFKFFSGNTAHVNRPVLLVKYYIP
jgi:exo-beta-1,3-glucanase (GH17 family)